MKHLLIRPALAADLPALVDIFNHYVVHGHVTFAVVPHTVASRRPWFDSFGDGPHQILVGESGGVVVGCAYSSRYRPGPAFDTTVETSIYLHPNERQSGVGSRLYAELLKRLAAQPLHLAVAGVALPNPASLALHRRMGFDEVGTFREYARKHDTWISSTWFQRRVGLAVASSATSAEDTQYAGRPSPIS